MLDTYGIMRVLRAQQDRLTIARDRRTIHTPVSGCCALSKHTSASKRAICVSSEVQMKQCTKCDEWKNESAFRFERRSCRECERIYNKTYNATHIEKRRAYARQERIEHKDRVVQRERVYREKNRNILAQKAAYYRARHPDKARASKRKSGRAYYHRHKEKAKTYGRLYRQQNKDKVNARTHRRRARKQGNGGTFTAMQWRVLCQKYNYRCLCCGKHEPDIKLTIDHVIPIVRGGINTIDNIQPLCGECNSSKGDKLIDYRPDRTERSQVEQLSIW